ncbi:MAG: hypothetical protein ABW098_05405 [Candidatus Thiodiazotropha sp.]
MKKINYKYLPPIGPASVESEDILDDFLISLPHLLYMGYVPPLDIINLFLAGGRDEAGMSGGAEWKPFTIDKKEYDEILASLKGRTYHDQERYNFTLTEEQIKTKNEWYAKVMEHKLGIPYARHLELMEREQSLQIKSEEAYDKGNKELGDKLHVQWHECTNELEDFCNKYFHK